MLNYVTAPLIASSYAILYGPWAGGIAGVLVGFVQLVFGVLSHPVAPETPQQTCERKALNREIAWLLLATSAVGVVLANLS